MITAKKFFVSVKKRWYLVLLVFVIVVGFIYKTTLSEQKNKKRQTYKVKKQTLKETLSLSGEIDAEEKVTLRFQTSGRLVWVAVKEGDYVKKYQTVASLDRKEVQKKLEKGLRDYSKERNDFEEDKQVTYKNGALTDTIKRILEKNQYDLDKAVLDVEIQNLAIEYSNLITPIAGIVTKVGSPFAGVNITPTQAEFEIVNPKTVYFSGNADQTDVVKLIQDQTAKITLDPYEDRKITGKIKSIGFTPKEGETGTVYEVKLVIDQTNDDYTFRLGMTGDANFVVREIQDVISIPATFIKSEKGKKYVEVLKGSNKIKKFIKTGEAVDSAIEIRSGLEENDVIYD